MKKSMGSSWRGRNLGTLAMTAAACMLCACGGQRAGGGPGGGGADAVALADLGYTAGRAHGSSSGSSPAVTSMGTGGGGSIDAYIAGQYASAKSLAEAEMRRSSGREHDRAALIAGMAAHAMDQDAEAERILGPLASHDDREISGRAEACLGLIARKRIQHDRAVNLLTSAARKLTGDDAARAAMYAGDSLASLGRHEQARTQWAVGGSLATSPALKESIRDRIENNTYAVQIGVFTQRTNAQNAMADARARSAGLGLGEPRMIERVDASGRPSYAVLLGRFGSRQQAVDAQTRLGSGWPVAVAGE